MAFLGLQAQLSYGHNNRHSPLLLRVMAHGARSSQIANLRPADARPPLLSRSVSMGSDFIRRTDSGAKYLNMNLPRNSSSSSLKTFFGSENQNQIVHPYLCSSKQHLQNQHLHHQHLISHPMLPSVPQHQQNGHHKHQRHNSVTSPLQV